MPVETEFAGGFELAQEDVERREKNAGHKRTMHMWKNALNHVWNKTDRRNSKANWSNAKNYGSHNWSEGEDKILNFDKNPRKLSVVWGFWPKVYHWKSVFFGREKILKFGRKCPEPAGMVLNPFWTPQQKHLTPFHKKIMLRSSILEKISPTKRGGYFRTARYQQDFEASLLIFCENQKIFHFLL